MSVRDGLFIGRRAPKRPKSAIADLGGGQPPQSALLESRSAFGRKAVLRALCGGPSFSGGDDQRRRTRVAGATGALAAGAPRPRCRDLRLAAFAGFGSAAGSAIEEAQAPPARPHFLYRGPAHPRHYCLRPSPRSLRLNAGLADHLGPALGLVVLELRHVLRAAAAGAELEVAEPCLGRRLVEDFVDRAVEFRNDRSRRLGRRADGIPGVREEARYADLDQRRNVRQDIEPLVGRDRKNSGLAAFV